MAEVPPYDGNEWLTLQFSRSSKLFPPPILWLLAGLVGVVVRRPKRRGLALLLAGAALLVLVVQALAIYTIVEFAVPVVPALVVLGAAGLVGTRTALDAEARITRRDLRNA
jgi:CHASE2 domain-containing sensor protein